MIKLISYEVKTYQVCLTVEVTIDGWTKPMHFVREYDKFFFVRHEHARYFGRHIKIANLIVRTLNDSDTEELRKSWVEILQPMISAPTVDNVFCAVNKIRFLTADIETFDIELRNGRL